MLEMNQTTTNTLSPDILHLIRQVTPSMEDLSRAQDRWCESLISDESLCDAVALVGPERQRVPFLRALLATMSTPLKAALYGEFREGYTRELVLEDVSVDAFDVMLRVAYHLDPKLTPKRAIHGLKVARVYMIEDLEKHCWQHLHHLEGAQALQVLTESLKLCLELPEELQHRCWSNILANSAEVVQSPFFVEAHGSVIAKLIKLDEFHVKEETLWERLLEWSAHAVRNPELLGPFAAATPCQSPKRTKTDADDSSTLGPSEVAQQKAVLSLLSQHIRFAQMQKDFFVDKVRTLLEREKADAVMDYFLLGRASEGLLTNRRVGLEDCGTIEMVQDCFEVSNFQQTKIEFSKSMCVTRVEVEPAQIIVTIDIPKWHVSLRNMNFRSQYPHSCVVVTCKDPCDELWIYMKTPPTIYGGFPGLRFKVFGKDFKGPVEIADQVVRRLSSDLLVRPECTNDDMDHR